MRLLPSRHYEFVSIKAPAEVEAAVRAAVGPRRYLGISAPTRVSMTVNPLVLAFMVLWLGGVAVGGVTLLSEELRRGDLSPGLLALAGMFVFGLALAVGAFTFEARRAVALLASTMTARLGTEVVQPDVAADRAALRR